MKKLNWHKIIIDTYIELYNNSYPQADFNKLMEEATINDRGQKVIPFNDYEIEASVMDSIVDSFAKRYKMSKHDRNAYEFNIYLGCSPKTKINDEIPSDLH